MDTYKKYLEYEDMHKDGIISEAELEELKDILYSQNKAKLGVRDKSAFEELLKKGAFEEAKLKLDNKTAASYREAIALFESLGDWGEAASFAEQCRSELPALEEQEGKAGLKKPEEQKASKDQLLQVNSYMTGVAETSEFTEDDNNAAAASSGTVAQKASEYIKGFKLTKKTVIIIAVAVLVFGIIIAGLKPKADHYTIYYTSAKAYNGNSTSNLESDMQLYAVYANGEEKEIDKDKWDLTYPSTLTAPETQITIKYKGTDLLFDMPVSY